MKLRTAFAVVFPILLTCAPEAPAHKVEFGPGGMVRVEGKPSFPIGIWVYGLNTDVMADLHEHRFNTIVGVGFQPSDLPLIERHGMMCIPSATDAWLAAAKDSPALLGWYLMDEPEEHGVDPAEAIRQYQAFKKKDPHHPIGVTHNQLQGPPKYKGSSDFTMSDVYPVDRERKWPLNAVGMYTANTRAVHGPDWTNFTFIQTFGGPDTDGGIWAQPLPHEVRFMAFNALVHRANGIFYFSHWPRAPITWNSVARLNRDIERLVPWLLAPGEEKSVSSSDPAIEVRARKVGDAGWLVIATNNQPKTISTAFKVDGMGDVKLEMPFAAGRVKHAKAGQWRERFSAYEEKVYLVGDEPDQP